VFHYYKERVIHNNIRYSTSRYYYSDFSSLMCAEMATAVVQGASRGLGLEFVRQLTSRATVASVVATCRNPEAAENLKGLAKVKVFKLDAVEEEDAERLADFVRRECDGRVDLLVNAAGMLHPTGKGETRLADLDGDALRSTMALNAFGPLTVIKHLSPFLMAGSGAFGTQSKEAAHVSVVANISARVGSITDNRLGGWYSYRMSKAALNMATKTLSVELGRGKRKVICLCLHPGTVATDLTAPYRKGMKEEPFSPDFSVGRMLDFVDKATFEDTGRFVDWKHDDIQF